MRLVLITVIGAHFGAQLIKMSARRHLAEDEPGSIGAKFGAVAAL